MDWKWNNVDGFSAMSFREDECLTIEFLEITGQKLAIWPISKSRWPFFLGGRESLSFRNRSTIVGKAPSWICSGLFLPSYIKKGAKVLVE